MQRGRLLIIVALILIVLSVGGIFLVLNLASAPQAGTDPNQNGGQPVVEVTATPAQVLNIIVASQNLNRGDVIPTEALSSFPWPTEIVPPSAITDPALVVGARARYTLQRGEPIFSTMIVQSLQQISPAGSDAAGQIPPGFTAISVPYDKRSGVALGIEDGDYVNVIVSWALVDIDEDFQTLLPNLTSGVAPGIGATAPDGSTIPSTSSVAVVVGPTTGSGQGRVTNDTVLNQAFYLVPSEQQRARLVSQSVIQNAMVLRVGEFKKLEGGPAAPPTAAPAAPPDPNATATPPPPPTATPLPPDIITLVVSPQDAVVLDYVTRLAERYPDAVKFTFTLRSAGDTTLAETQSVTLQYMFERYNISLPAKLNYGLDAKVLPTPVTPTAP